MKLNNNHIMIDIVNGNPIHYNYFHKLVLTPKSFNESVSINIKITDSDNNVTFDSLIDGLNMLVKTLPRRKLLISDTESKGMCFEYETNGLFMIIKIHFYMFNKINTYEFSYLLGTGIMNCDITTDLTTDEKIQLNQLSKEKEFSNYTNWFFYMITKIVLPQIVYIEFSKEKIRQIILKPKTQFGNIMKGNHLKNETSFNVTLVDSLWTVKTIGVGVFQVRGHFRLQPCGVGLCDYKLIYIDKYVKTHYIRKSTRELTFGNS